MKRRVFLTTALPTALGPALAGSAALGTVLFGCSKSFTCGGDPTLAPTHHETRQKFTYVDRSSDITKTCERCAHYGPAEQCGTCRVLPGPIHPQGSCDLFASK